MASSPRTSTRAHLTESYYERIAEPDRLLLPLKPVHFLALET
jgi:hypothetical protein